MSASTFSFQVDPLREIHHPLEGAIHTDFDGEIKNNSDYQIDLSDMYGDIYDAERKDSASTPLIFSLLMHVALIVFLIFGGLREEINKESIILAQTKNVDVAFIPLSANDTFLPLGSRNGVNSEVPVAPRPPPIVSPVVEKPKVLPETKSMKPKVVAKRVPTDSPTSTVRKEKIVEPKAAVPIPIDSSDASSSSTANYDLGASADNNQDNSVSGVVGDASTISPVRLGIADGDSLAGRARIGYQDLVAARLAKVKRYPERAIRRGYTGDGSLRLEIVSDGSVVDLKIIKSTERDILDQEILAMVERASPFPAFPPDLKKSRLVLVVPVRFDLH